MTMLNKLGLHLEVTDYLLKIARCAQCGITWCVDPVSINESP